MALKSNIRLLLLILFCCIVAACSNTRHLPAGERLFKGSKIHIEDNRASKKERKILAGDLVGVVRPKTNTKTLGVRLKLTLYNLAGNTKKTKGIHKLLRNLGEPPVLASSVHLNTNKELMVNLLQNRGFFYPSIRASMDTDKHRKATAVFNVTTDSQYTIKSVYFEKNARWQISHDIDSEFKQTLLTVGSPYNLDLIKAERNRIDRELKELGYYNFKPDYILVLVDSSIGEHKVNMYVKLKGKEIPPEAYTVYTMDSIYVYADYRLHGKESDTIKANQVAIDNYYIIDPKNNFRPSIFDEALIFEKGDVYSLNDQNTSLSRLINMGMFKFVKNRFVPKSDSLLDVYYYLTAYPKKSLTFQIGALTQNDNRAGTEASISFKNRNTFKGAEELLIKINGGFEAQYSGEVKQPNIYNFGAETDLSFPRFVVPFINIQTQSRYLPRSIIKLKYSYESESDLLRINSYTASYGYDWKEGPRKEHQLYPINFTYVKTDTLGNASNLNLLYGNLIFNGIILGPTYEFTYNSQVGPTRKNSFYFDGLVDLSGNILGVLQHADYETNPQKIFGLNYAQYVKLQPDFRYYRRLSDASTIAYRLMAGIGIPYGNSESLPNIKEFWAGGNSDLRGFPSRLVGPGTFDARATGGKAQYIETLGDMKMETNLELRQHIYKFINIGLFADAGNIWLYHKNPLFPGGTFTSDFYKQLVADVGFGFRFDFKILLLRLDLGMPIRDQLIKNMQPDGNIDWVFNQISFADPTWRKNNLIFNIAIGYPF